MANTLTGQHYFLVDHKSATPPTDPNLFSADDIATYMLIDSVAISSATSKAVSTVSAAAPDSVNLSIADSKGVSAGGRASVADSKAVSVSGSTSTVDSKAASGSVNTSVADSKAVSVATATPTLTVVANSQNVSTADSKATSVAAAVPTVPTGRTVTSIGAYLKNNARVNVKDYGAVGDGVTDDTAAVLAAIAAITAAVTAGLISNINGNAKGLFLYFPAGTYKLTSDLGRFNGAGCVGIVGDGHDQTAITMGSTTITLDASTATNKTATAFTVTTGAISLAANLNTSLSTYDRTVGSFVTDGFCIGQYVVSTGFANNVTKNRILAVSATQLTMEDALVTEAAAGARTLTVSNVLVDTGQNWSVANSLVGKIVEIISGTGSGQKRRVLAHTATGLVVAPWKTPPSGTVTYRMYTGPVGFDIGPTAAAELAYPNQLLSRFTLAGLTVQDGGAAGTYSYNAVKVTAVRNMTIDDVYVTFNSAADNTSCGLWLNGHDESTIRNCVITAALPIRFAKDTTFGYGYGYDNWTFQDLILYSPSTGGYWIDGHSALMEVDVHSNGFTSCNWSGKQSWIGGNGCLLFHGVGSGLVDCQLNNGAWESGGNSGAGLTLQSNPAFRIYYGYNTKFTNLKTSGYGTQVVMKVQGMNGFAIDGWYLESESGAIPFSFDNSNTAIDIARFSCPLSSADAVIGSLLPLIDANGVIAAAKGFSAYMRFQKSTAQASTNSLYGEHRHAETVTVPGNGSVTLNTPYLNVTYKLTLRIEGEWPNDANAPGFATWGFSGESAAGGSVAGTSDAVLTGAANKVGITCAAGAQAILTNGYATPRKVHLRYKWGAGF